MVSSKLSVAIVFIIFSSISLYTIFLKQEGIIIANSWKEIKSKHSPSKFKLHPYIHYTPEYRHLDDNFNDIIPGVNDSPSGPYYPHEQSSVRIDESNDWTHPETGERHPLGASLPKPPTLPQLKEYQSSIHELLSSPHAVRPSLWNEVSSETNRMETETDYTIRMKVLVLTPTADADSRPTLGVIREMLSGFGVNYLEHRTLDRETGEGPQQRVDLPPLLDESGNPNWYGIVLTDSALAFFDNELGVFQSSLTEESWTELRDYSSKYGVRTVTMFSYPQTQPGIIPPPDGTSREDTIKFDANLKNCDPFLVGGLKPDIEFIIPELSIWHYPVLHVPVLPEQNAPDVRIAPLMRFGVDDTVAAAIILQQDGREELQYYFDASIYTPHGLAIASSWVNWLTRGVYSGARRIYLSAQIDDVFLSTEVWNDEKNRRGKEGERTVRVIADDWEDLKAWQIAANARLPPGSDFIVEQAYNGFGVGNQEEKFTIDTMYEKSRELAIREVFFWVSHTWSHLDLTCPESECDIYGSTNYTQATDEVQRNIRFARDRLFDDIPNVELPTGGHTTYSPKSMVTPKISGLVGNGESLQALSEGGISYVVGDNSRRELIPDNLYHGIWTDFYTHGWVGIFIIPRFPTNIFFDVSLPIESVSEFNGLYGPGGLFAQFADPWTMDMILEDEGRRTVINLLKYRHDPYMFHQANLHAFDYNGERHSLLSLWADSVFDSYLEYFSEIPLLTYKQDDIAELLYLPRMARDACDITGYITYVDGSVDSMDVISDATNENCTVTDAVITGVQKPVGTTWPSDVNVEEYGPDVTTRIPLNPGETRSLDILPSTLVRECYVTPDPAPCASCIGWTTRRCFPLPLGPNGAIEYRCFDCIAPKGCPTVQAVWAASGGLVMALAGASLYTYYKNKTHHDRMVAEEKNPKLRERQGDEKSMARARALMREEVAADKVYQAENPNRAQDGESYAKSLARSASQGRSSAGSKGASRGTRSSSKDSKGSRGSKGARIRSKKPRKGSTTSTGSQSKQTLTPRPGSKGSKGSVGRGRSRSRSRSRSASRRS